MIEGYKYSQLKLLNRCARITPVCIKIPLRSQIFCAVNLKILRTRKVNVERLLLLCLYVQI